MVDAVESIQRRERSENRTEAAGLELATRDEVHRPGSGRRGVRRNADEAQNDMQAKPDSTRALWLEERTQPGDIGADCHQRGYRRCDKREAYFTGETFHDDERDRQHEPSEGKPRAEARQRRRAALSGQSGQRNRVRAHTKEQGQDNRSNGCLYASRKWQRGYSRSGEIEGDGNE